LETHFLLYNIFLNLTLNNVLAEVFKDDLGICLDTIYIVIDSITTNFDHRFNEPSSELL
jgi:hypothetical protein